MSDCEFYYSHSHDPYFNLAMEDCLFRCLSEKQQILFVYQNEPSLVFGHFQNPWLEANPRRIMEDGIHFVRRQSGGGAVYHDLGNLNFCFMGSAERIPKSQNLQLVLQALKNLGVNAFENHRNDLMVKIGGEDHKFSGSAFKKSRKLYFHHGTLLVDSNISDLWRYLEPQWQKMESRSIPSVRSKVANLKQLVPDLKIQDIIQELAKVYFDFLKSTGSIKVLAEHSKKDFEQFDSCYQKLTDWQWKFGETPLFTAKLDFCHTQDEVIPLSLTAHRGVVKSVDLTAIDLHPELLSQFEEALKGTNLENSSLSQVGKELEEEFPMYQKLISNLMNCLR